MTDDELVRTKAMMRFGVPAGLLALLAFTGPAAGARGTAGQGSGIQWVELDDAAPAEDVPRIAWSEVGDDTWLFESPTLELGSGAEPSLWGWVTVTGDEIRMRFEVLDDEHHNVHAGGELYNGDSIQLGLAALGAGAGPPANPSLGPGDAFLMLALTTAGAEGFGMFGGQDDVRTLDGWQLVVTRDEEERITAYDLRLPWTELQAAPGISARLGLALQLNDVDRAGLSSRLRWGAGVSSVPDPTQFRALVIGAPGADFASALATSTTLWTRDASAEVRLAWRSRDGIVVRVAAGPDERREFRVAGSAELHRAAIRFRPDASMPEPISLEVTITGGDGRALASTVAEVHSADALLDRLRARVRSLRDASEDPLFARHLSSLQALVDAEWARALDALSGGPQAARATLASIRTLLDGLEGDAGRPESFLVEGRRPLILGFESRSDRSLQFYAAALPDGFRSGESLPMVVELHGTGPAEVLSAVVEELGLGPPDPGGAERIVRAGRCLRIRPWGRGNAGFQGLAEDDVWQSIEEARDTFSVDGDRISLTGHSMGAFAAWALGARTPDRWAAICIEAGGTRDVHPGLELGQNLASIPVRLWHGKEDGAVPVAEALRMQDELRRYGSEPVVILVPGQGHGVPVTQREDNLRWLLQHRRERPARFSFVCDTEEHRGAWGVRLKRDTARSLWPRFECHVEGSTVRVVSEGTSGLTIEAGKEGLGLEGRIEVFWNGAPVFAGPAQRITLGEGAD